MSLTSALDDDHLASLLVQDARKTSERYASQGLSALLSKRPTSGAAPKPNTRFLKSLVRDADTHNAKLKEKEESEVRERLRKIREEERKKEREKADQLSSGRHRKKRRLSHDERHEKNRLTRHDRHERPRERRQSRSPERERKRKRQDDYDDRREQRRNTSSPEDETSLRRRRRQRRENTSSGDDITNENEDRSQRASRHHRPTRRRHSRSPSSLPSRSREKRAHHRERKHEHSPESRRREQRERSPAARAHPHTALPPQNESKRRRHNRSTSLSSASSDLLTSLLNVNSLRPSPNSPPVTTKKRGRGFLRPTNPDQPSNIDLHFSQSYNPSDSHKEDAQEEDDDDWTPALTHLHSRHAFHTAQTARMREAGFTEEEISRWEKSSTHPSRTLLGGSGEKDRDRDTGDLSSMTWKKRGEEREWDVGKVVEREDPPSSSADSESEKTTALQTTALQTTKTKTKPARSQAAKSTSRQAKLTAAKGDETSAWQRPQNGLLKQFKNTLG